MRTSRWARLARYVNNMKVVSFPTAVRKRREHLIRVAKIATPLLEAAVAAGDATLIARTFEALGAVARGEGALDVLEAVRFRDADVIPLRGSR